MAVWLILNGRITGEILLLGGLLSALIYLFLVIVMGYSPRKEWRMLRKSGLAAAYAAVLLWEILKANGAVLRCLYLQKAVVDPVIVRVDVPLKSETARVILANSITLTPGTITVSLEGSRLLVHCLRSAYAADLATSRFVRLLQKMER